MKKGQKMTWKTYEEVAAFVLNQCAEQFGLERFEGKQSVPGQTGTEWELDARGWFADGKTFVVVECKNHKDTAISQALTGSLAYTISDTGAAGGFLVSPNGLQAGAKKVAAASRITEVKLNPKSTTAAYFGEWLGSLRAGFNDRVGVNISEHLSIKETKPDGSVTEVYDSGKDNLTVT
jgi:hypothetical protein